MHWIFSVGFAYIYLIGSDVRHPIRKTNKRIFNHNTAFSAKFMRSPYYALPKTSMSAQRRLDLLSSCSVRDVRFEFYCS
jgi:hypothetical protein